MLIDISGVKVIYNKNTDFRHMALDNLNLTIDRGEFMGVVGHTGSGKTTLLQLLNGLEMPTEGRILIDELNTTHKANLSLIRQKVGLVFQYPEHQLFGATVFEDVAFGLKNQGVKDEGELTRLVKAAMDKVGLDYDYFHHLNPLSLSGGEQRKVAIAGILACQPEVLALDEPLAGLDLTGKSELVNLLKKLHNQGTTIILVSHNMDIILDLASRVLVFNQGKLAFDGEPVKAFINKPLMAESGLDMPDILRVSTGLKEKGIEEEGFFRVEEGIATISRLLEGKKNV